MIAMAKPAQCGQRSLQSARRGQRSTTSLCAAIVIYACLCYSCGTATSAEEYYSIGMAYYEMGKYEEAERWLSRAVGQDKTMRASEYNLGRIQYETGRYTEASKRFEKILKKDPENVLALKAEAYTKIKMGDLKKAEEYYSKVLALEPESADDGYNYALVLFAMDKPAESEAVLLKYEYEIYDKKENLLLLARVQKAQGKLDAIDTYDKWLAKNADPQVRYEYATVLDSGGFYAKALEEMRKALSELSVETETLKRSTINFGIARLMLIADASNDEGITMLRDALSSGFKDMDAINDLIKDARLPKARQDEVQRTVDTILKAAESNELQSNEPTDSNGSDENEQ
jgi:tetratricopeptide (TPR) repeat protein